MYTVSKEDLQDIISSWGYPRYRSDQVYHWIREKGIVDADQMNNIPKKLRQDLKRFSSSEDSASSSSAVSSITSIPDNDGCLSLVQEQKSPKDGTIKRLYRLRDGYLIESVLMPYEDGRWTSCISSQAGCAMGCVFCATGQNGFNRQLTADEIVEQVTRFSTHLKSTSSDDSNSNSKENNKPSKHNKQQRLSNIVFMGEGEPLANYRNVMEAVPRIQELAGIGARRITISTVGVVPNMRKLMKSPLQVRLAVSLHCASDEERSALLPANKRFGGLHELMTTLHEYIETTGRRLTLEWALIEGENDTPAMAHKLGNLLKKYRLRKDMVHVNVIPLNPTGGYGGTASGRKRVNEFIRILEEEFGIACTPRVRRGIDIDAGCGQLKAKELLKEEEEKLRQREEQKEKEKQERSGQRQEQRVTTPGEFSLDIATVDLDSDFLYSEDEDDDDGIMDETFDPEEATRLLALVKGTTIKGAGDDEDDGEKGER